MATNSNLFKTLVSGVEKLAIAISTSAGGSDANKIIATNGSGELDATFLPTGVGATTVVANASEDLAAMDLVNVWDDAGTVKIRKADGSTTGKAADGFVIAAVTTGNPATMYDSGKLTGLTGLTDGAAYYLSTTAGSHSTTAPSANGQTSQRIGKAVSDTEVLIRLEEPCEIDIA